jgi:hypothetical protein
MCWCFVPLLLEPSTEHTTQPTDASSLPFEDSPLPFKTKANSLPFEDNSLPLGDIPQLIDARHSSAAPSQPPQSKDNFRRARQPQPCKDNLYRAKTTSAV